ncbi:MAG: Gldg family protein, partial [Saprospiraceae bacterium]
MKVTQYNRWFQWSMVVAIVVLINVISGYIYTEVDLTDDDRFTISDHTKKIVRSVNDQVTVRVLLEGKFPAGFKRLQSSVRDMLDKLRDVNPNIVYQFEDPTSGTQSEIEQKRKVLIDDNIIPISLSYSDGTEVVQKAVFPFAVLYYGSKKYVINLLEEQKPGDDEDIILNKSVALLEYKFANAFQKILAERPKNIIFTQGSDEWDESQTFRLESEIRRFHRVGRLSLDTLQQLDSLIDLVIVAGPKREISLQNQFKLDQYLMQGGKIIWLIDRFHISLDSINKYKMYIPTETETGLGDMLFKYGVRIMPDLVLDLECSQIPQVIGMAGDKPQTKLFPWIYHPAVAPRSVHPIVKNIDRVNLFFPSTIDTIKTESNVTKTILLASSPYSRAQLSPVRLSFEMLKVAPDPARFNDG